MEVSALYVPTMGNDFHDLSGYGISGALSSEYDFSDGPLNEFLVAQLEGLYVHGSGDIDRAGVSQKASVDAGFGFLNIGLGMHSGNWSFMAIAGTGIGTAKVQGDVADKSIELDTALQIKPRVTWRSSRNWSWFAEYRFLATASTYGDFFEGDPRALRLQAVGLGVVHTF